LKADYAVVLGEVLCDLFSPQAGVRIEDALHLVPCLGGAPTNVAVQLARMGCKVELISALGDDPIADRLLSALAREGIGVGSLHRRADWKTGLTLVEVDTTGERRFYPFWEKSSDLSIGPDDVDERKVASASLFHYGTVCLRSLQGRQATDKAVRAARDSGAIVSLDVNLRYGLYPTREELQDRARAAVKTADVIKLTDEEARDLYGEHDLDGYIEKVHSEGPQLVLLTLGPAGAVISSRTTRVRVPSIQVKSVDATGAGDAFMGASLAELIRRAIGRGDLGALDANVLEELGKRACRAGALTTTALGATTAMPRGTV
jgi:fructokinase